MKKSLIAAAVAGLFVAPAAMADVTISGAVNVGIAFIDSDNSTPGTPGSLPDDGVSKTSLATNYSNVNISSVDDIGNGNKVILNIQFDLGALNNTGSFGNRNSYLGIEGGWGSFKMGTNENVYERWAYESDPLDGAMGIGGNIQMLGQTGLAAGAHDWFDTGNGQTATAASDAGSFWRRTHHTIWYNSPVIANAFTFEIDRTLSAYKTATLDPVVTSLGAQFKPEGGKFFVNVGYETHDEANSFTVGVHDATGTSVGGGIALGNFLITARYEMLEWDTVALGKFERTHMWAGVKWTLPGGYFGAEIGMADKLDTAAGNVPDSEAMMIGLGYFHNLSKQSQLYVVGTQISNDDNAFYGIGAGTGSYQPAGTVAAGDQMAVTVGIKHTF